MNTYHTETLMPKDGSLILSGLPFKKGEKVDITLRTISKISDEQIEKELAGSVLSYINPFEPVSENYWEALQ